MHNPYGRSLTPGNPILETLIRVAPFPKNPSKTCGALGNSSNPQFGFRIRAVHKGSVSQECQYIELDTIKLYNNTSSAEIAKLVKARV